mmetsp:Transcript_3976/g.6916  ORF Transcript_3976/g.6916 Transcript_3976/m.6916 type:complete len:1721 (-) Transcript_3976:97-5259(-)
MSYPLTSTNNSNNNSNSNNSSNDQSSSNSNLPNPTALLSSPSVSTTVAAATAADGFTSSVSPLSPLSPLSTCIYLLGKRFFYLQPDHRRNFFSILQGLIDKSNDADLLYDICEVVSGWMLARDVPNSLQQKEKIDVILKMTHFEKISSPKLHRAFLDMVHRLYLDASTSTQVAVMTPGGNPGLRPPSNTTPNTITRDFQTKIERALMMGLRSSDPPTRRKFIELYGTTSRHQSICQRLMYILEQQDWECVSDSFWIKEAVDLLTATIPPFDIPLLQPDTAHLPALRSSSAPSSSYATAALLAIHARFLSDIASSRGKDVMDAVRELSHIDSSFASFLWLTLFSRLWAHLSPEEQASLSRPLAQLLPKDYHHKQRNARPNVVQVILEGISLCRPQPRLPPEVVKFAGKNFNAWHIAVPMLEAAATAGPTVDEKSGDALGELYKLLHEDDLVCGLWRRRSNSEETRSGLALEQLGMWQRAQEVFFAAMTKAQTQTGTSVGVPGLDGSMHGGGGGGGGPVSKAEMCLWEEHWIQCARQLNQWDVLTEFSRSVNHTEMLAECLWKIPPDWGALTDLLANRNASAASSGDSSQSVALCIYSTYVALQEGRLSEAEQQCTAGMQAVLGKWHGLADCELATIAAHIPLLQNAHQLVELQESAQIVLEINDAGRRPGLPELKGIIATWKERVPNKWEDITVWTDVLTWREHMFTFIGNAALAPPLHNVQVDLAAVGYTQVAAARTKLAHVARMHGMPDVCMTLLNQSVELSPPQDDKELITDTFMNLREQLKCCMCMSSASPNAPLGAPGTNTEDLQRGLQLINEANIDLFVLPVHKAEMYQLKAELLRLSDLSDQANHAYSNALSVYNQFYRGWLSWGAFCDGCFTESNGKHIRWAEYAVNCYLQAVRYGSEKGRALLSRVIMLLGADDESGAVGKAFEKYAEHVHMWAWVSWLPQLLSSLSLMPEAPRIRSLLTKLANVFPQAMFFPLRALIQERHHARSQHALLAHTSPTAAVAAFQYSTAISMTPALSLLPTISPANTTTSSSSIPVSPIPTIISHVTPEDLLTTMNNSHPSLVKMMDRFATELVTAMQPHPLDSLLAHIQTLLTRCYQLPANNSSVPTSIVCELEAIVRLHTTPWPQQPSSQPSPAPPDRSGLPQNVWAGSPTMSAFISEFKPSLESDLWPASPNPPYTSLPLLISRLQSWRTLLQSRVDALPIRIGLETLSTFLLNLRCPSASSTSAIPHTAPIPSPAPGEPPALPPSPSSPTLCALEMPGQYVVAEDRDLAADQHIRIESIDATVHVIRRSSTRMAYHKILLRGTDGRTSHFLIQPWLSSFARAADDRLLHLHRLLNRLLDKNIETRRRNLTYAASACVCIPLAHSARLFVDHPTHTSLADVYHSSFGHPIPPPTTSPPHYGSGLHAPKPSITPLWLTEADSPILRFRQLLAEHASTSDLAMTGSPQHHNDVRLRVYDDVKRGVSDMLLAEYMHACCKQSSQVLALRKQFTSQLALVSFSGFALGLSARSADRVTFWTSTGQVLHSESSLPTYPALTTALQQMEQQSVMDRETAQHIVPFRLTRNLCAFMNPFGLEGLFSAVISATANCLSQAKHLQLYHFLSLHFRDELIALRLSVNNHNNTSQSPSSPPHLSPEDISFVRGGITARVEHVLRKVHSMASSSWAGVPSDPQSQQAVGRTLAINQDVINLLQIASDDRNLCKMEITWLPFL